jgi:hypothetical protein
MKTKIALHSIRDVAPSGLCVSVAPSSRRSPWISLTSAPV